MISSLYEPQQHNQLPYGGGKCYKPTAATAAVAAATAAVAVAKASGQVILGTPAFSASSLSPPGVEEFSTPLLNSSDPAVTTFEWVDQTPGAAFSTEPSSSILTPTTKTNILATPKNYISTSRPLYMEKRYNTQDSYCSVTRTIPWVESSIPVITGQNNVSYYGQGTSITNVNTNQSFGQQQANKPYTNATIYLPVEQQTTALLPAQDPSAIRLEFLNPTSPSSFQHGNLIQYPETTTSQGSQMLLEQSISRPLFPPAHPSLPPTGTFQTSVLPPPPPPPPLLQPFPLQSLHQPFQALLQPVPTASSALLANPAPVEKRYQCQICHKYFRRDLPRHMRTHQETARFTCPFPRKHCPHKRGQFNRPYDFKKHLLHGHFVFDDQKNVRAYRDLKRKLGCMGVCMCGTRFLAEAWLDCHVLSKDKRCALLSGHNSISSANSTSRPARTTNSKSSQSSSNGARHLTLPNRSGQENPLPCYRPQVLDLEMKECVHGNQN